MKVKTIYIFKYSFAFLCVLTTFVMAMYWCCKFSLNEDLSVVSYRNFYEKENDIHPTISMCLRKPFVRSRLAEYGVNESAYLAFLEGKYFSEEMLSIDFNRVTIDIVDHIKNYLIALSNGTYITSDTGLSIQDKKSIVHISFIGLHNSNFVKCFALNIPKMDNLEFFRVLLSNNIFQNGIRPTYAEFVTFVHLPHQFLLSGSTETWIWPYRTRNESYKMRSLVKGVTVETKRSKKDNTCNEHWKEYDDWIIKRHKNRTRCNSPYEKQDETLPLCNTQRLMLDTLITSAIVETKKYEKPCRTMEGIHIKNLESNMKKIENESVGEFWFSIGFLDHRFKDIRQTR